MWRVCSASSKLARAGRWTTPTVAGLNGCARLPMLWTRNGGFDDVFVCGCAGRPQIKHEPQLAPIVSGSNMRRAPWSSVAPRVSASCYHRGMGERMFELWASTASRVASFCSTQNCVRHFVFASRAGRHWLFERFTRDRRIRPQSWMARCVTPILFTRVCVCLSSENLRALLQGPCVSVKKRHAS